MQMRSVQTMGISDVADLLAPADWLTFCDQYLVQVSVQGVNVSGLTVFQIHVPDHDNVAPGPPEISSQRHNSAANGTYRRAKHFTGPIEAHPILAKVPINHEAPRFVVSVSVGRSERKVKAVRDTEGCEIRLRDGAGPGQDGNQSQSKQQPKHEGSF